MMKWKKVIFNDSNLSSSEFIQSKLKDIDLSSCNIEDIKVDINNLKGCSVNLEQALELSLLMGINIK